MQQTCRWMRGIMTVIVVTVLVIAAHPATGQNNQIIDDFEGGDFDARWWWFTDGSPLQCAVDSPGYNSDHAMRITYDNATKQWAGCGTNVYDPVSWRQAEGLRFVWRSDTPDKYAQLTLNITDPTQTHPDSSELTPFEAYLTTPGIDWEEVILPWDAFVKAEWVGPSGIGVIDFSQLGSFIFVTDQQTSGTIWIDDIQLLGGGPPPSDFPAGYDKFALWTNGTQLRGVNTWQRVVVPAIDGDEFLGANHVGPPYELLDFQQMAQMGANLVILSFPGLFTETPPYVLDEAIQTQLDLTLAMLTENDLFAVIAFRTGPGRSDFTFYDEGIEEWGDPTLVRDNVWTDQAAQDAWVEMWCYTAERYRGDPNIVGYELMVEPNAAGRMLEIWDPEDFYPAYEGTLYDWNQFYPRLVIGIREVDGDTPILVSPMGWGAVRWLPYLRVIDDRRIVYSVHQYEPQDQYTHQEPGGTHTYPGQFDLNWDDMPEAFNIDWLNKYLSPIHQFQAQYGVPVAVTEYGVERWVPNADAFMHNEMSIFEEFGLNHAFWVWSPIWPPYNVEDDDFNIWHGPDPSHHENVETSALIEIVRANWNQNQLRPSAFRR